MGSEETKTIFTPEECALIFLFVLALITACLGYGSLAIVIAIITGSLRISKAINRLASPPPDLGGQS